MLDYLLASSQPPLLYTGVQPTGVARFSRIPSEDEQRRRRAVQGSRLIGYKRKTKSGLLPLLAIYAAAVLLQLLILHLV